MKWRLRNPEQQGSTTRQRFGTRALLARGWSDEGDLLARVHRRQTRRRLLDHGVGDLAIRGGLVRRLGRGLLAEALAPAPSKSNAQHQSKWARLKTRLSQCPNKRKKSRDRDRKRNYETVDAVMGRASGGTTHTNRRGCRGRPAAAPWTARPPPSPQSASRQQPGQTQSQTANDQY